MHHRQPLQEEGEGENGSDRAADECNVARQHRRRDNRRHQSHGQRPRQGEGAIDRRRPAVLLQQHRHALRERSVDCHHHQPADAEYRRHQEGQTPGHRLQIRPLTRNPIRALLHDRQELGQQRLQQLRQTAFAVGSEQQGDAEQAERPAGKPQDQTTDRIPFQSIVDIRAGRCLGGGTGQQGLPHHQRDRSREGDEVNAAGQQAVDRTDHRADRAGNPHGGHAMSQAGEEQRQRRKIAEQDAERTACGGQHQHCTGKACEAAEDQAAGHGGKIRFRLPCGKPLGLT